MTRGYLGLAAFDLLVIAVGYVALYGIGVIRTRRLAWRGVALAFFTGWALLGVCCTTALALGARFGLLFVLVAALLLVGVSFGARRWFPTLERAPVRETADPLLRGLAVLGAVVIVLALGVAVVAGLHADADSSYDLYAFWLLKAKAIYFLHGFSSGLSGTGTYVHPSYPMLIPTMTATEFQFMGGTRTLLLPLQQSIVGIAFFGSVATLLSSRVPRWLTYPALAMLIATPGFSARIIFVLPDWTLAYLFVLAAIATILWIEEQRPAWLVLGTLFLTAAVLTKAEAQGFAVFFIVAFVGAAVAMRGRQGLRGAALAVALAMLLPWRHWLTSHHLETAPTDYRASSLLHPRYLSDNFSRFRYGIDSLQHWIFDGGTWLLVPTLFFVTLVVVARSKPALALAIAGWLVAIFCSIAVVYWISTPNIGAYVAESIRRITVVMPMAAATLMPLLLGLALERRARAD